MFNRFLLRFGRQVGPMLATFLDLRPPKRPSRHLQNGPRWLSRRLGSRKPAQDASKPAPEPSRPLFFVDYLSNLVDCWLIFGRLLVDFYVHIRHRAFARRRVWAALGYVPWAQYLGLWFVVLILKNMDLRGGMGSLGSTAP